VPLRSGKASGDDETVLDSVDMVIVDDRGRKAAYSLRLKIGLPATVGAQTDCSPLPIWKRQL
jgi:hypothetical protein